MLEPHELQAFFSEVHIRVTREISKLMEGFYHNVEDGLFEHAYAQQDESLHRRAMETMRELRFRHQQLIDTFKQNIHAAGQGWLGQPVVTAHSHREQAAAKQMAGRCLAHFGALLQTITERTAHASRRDIQRSELPISPEIIARCFLESCHSVAFDNAVIEMVKSLFERFVLDRLGTLYGDINVALQDAGYMTQAEHRALMEHSA